MTKPTKWPLRPARTQISLGIRPVWSEFAVCMKNHWVLSYPLRALQRLWSDWAVAQADPSLRWAQRSFCSFCHEAAHFSLGRVKPTQCPVYSEHSDKSSHPHSLVTVFPVCVKTLWVPVHLPIECLEKTVQTMQIGRLIWVFTKWLCHFCKFCCVPAYCLVYLQRRTNLKCTDRKWKGLLDAEDSDSELGTMTSMKVYQILDVFSYYI